MAGIEAKAGPAGCEEVAVRERRFPRNRPDDVQVEVPVRRFVLLYATGAGLLAIAGFAAEIVNFYRPEEGLQRVMLHEEGNIPSWYASSGLLISALLLGGVALGARAAGAAYPRRWGLLAAVVLVMSIEEAAAIHDVAEPKVRALLDVDGVLHAAWLLPVIALVPCVIVLYAPLVRSLPRRTRRLAVAAVALYLFGAMVLEFAVSGYGDIVSENLFYAVMLEVEEVFELAGITLFLYTLMDYAGVRLGALRVGFDTTR